MLKNNTEDSNNVSSYLASDYFADWNDPKIIEFTQSIVKENLNPRDTIIALYHYIRDYFLYDPFQISFDKKNMRASSFVEKKSGHCIDKANLLIACARQQNIPARYRFANVKNHIGTEKLEAILKTDVLVFHGMAEVFIDEKWIKLTPAFNKELCVKLNVEPLDFNGHDDAIFQEYNKTGHIFMEYLHDHGSFTTLPLQQITKTFFNHYPHLQDSNGEIKSRLIIT